MFLRTIQLLLVLLFSAPALMAQGGRPDGQLYLDGVIVRTHVVPAPVPNGGIDPLFMFTNGTTDQHSVVAFGPGSPYYQGGLWAVFEVTFDSGVTPYLITSVSELLDALAAGDVTVTRNTSLDNRCPINR
jgi:hypothetical protein